MVSPLLLGFIQDDKGEDYFTKFDKKFISGDWDARAQRKKEQKSAAEQSAKRQEELIGGQEERGTGYFQDESLRNKERDIVDNRYQRSAGENIDENYRNVRRSEADYRDDLRQAENVSNENMQNAKSAYQTLSPYHRDAMQSARTEADSAMSLQDYMDPNNQVASGVRDLYNQEGEGMFGRYDQQAQNIQRQGQANYGVLSSLGSQAAAQAMAGQGPMTVGQQMAQMAMANQQAGEAYANTQRRMQQLRDMGMSGREALRQAGLERGFERSDRAYEAGRLAKEDLARRMSDYEGFEDRNINRTSGISDRLVGLSGQELGSRGREEQTRFGGQMTKDTLARDTPLQRLARESGLSQQELEYFNQLDALKMGREDINLDRVLGRMQAEGAQQAADEAARRGLLTAGISAAGTIGGAMAGGPAGASLGGQAGQVIGQAMGPTTAPPVASTQPPAQSGYTSFGTSSYQPPSYQQPQYMQMFNQPPYQGPYRPTVNPGYSQYG